MTTVPRKGNVREPTRAEQIERRRVERIRIAWFTLVVVLILLAAPIVASFRDRMRDRRSAEKQITGILRDAARGKQPRERPPELVARPKWAEHIGTIVVKAGSSPKTVTGLAVEGSPMSIPTAYRLAMENLGWKMSSYDRNVEMMFFYRGDGANRMADVAYRNVGPNMVSIVVTLK